MQICTTENQLSWPQIQETNVIPTVATAIDNKPRLTLTVANTNQKPIVLDIQTVNGVSFVDISALPSDIYDVVLRFTAVGADWKEVKDNSNVIYTTNMRVQCVTKSSQGSVNVVTIPGANGIVSLSGNVANVTSVDMKIGNQMVNLEVNTKTALPSVDCSAYPSGTYQFIPLTADKTALLPTTPFTICTAIQSAQPMSEELDFLINAIIDTEDATQVQFVWNEVPIQFVQEPLTITCHYTDLLGKEQDFNGQV